MAEKTFMDTLDPSNPALGFISQESIKAVDGAGERASVLQGVRSIYAEPKSRRLQLLLTPTLYREMKAEARRRGLSINALVNVYIEEGLKNAKTKEQ